MINLWVSYTHSKSRWLIDIWPQAHSNGMQFAQICIRGINYGLHCYDEILKKSDANFLFQTCFLQHLIEHSLRTLTQLVSIKSISSSEFLPVRIALYESALDLILVLRKVRDHSIAIFLLSQQYKILLRIFLIFL